MKELKDYLHLYIGVPCVIGDMKWKRDENTHGLAPGIDLDYGKPIRTTVSYHVLNAYLHQTTLILRPLDSMTKSDIDLGEFIPDFEVLIQRFTGGYCVELDSVQSDGYCLTIYPDGSMYCVSKDNGDNYPYKGAELFKKLIDKGFDLFGLQSAGLAIYESDLEDPRDYKELDEPEPLNA